MPQPTRFRLVLQLKGSSDPLSYPQVIEMYDFEAFPSGSCTLAQHYAAKAWYSIQSKLDTHPGSGLVRDIPESEKPYHGLFPPPGSKEEPTR